MTNKCNLLKYLIIFIYFNIITYLTGKYIIKNNGSIKIIFSFDNGQTWKTYSDNEWNNLDVILPMKSYDNFDNTDKNNWNNAKNVILNNGINIQNLNNIDFDFMKINKMMFAITFNRPTYNDTCTLKSLDIKYDGITTYNQLAVGSDLTKYEAKVSITGDTIGVTTANNYDKLLITIATNI